ncbi:MAG TPA: metallophosphoesterase [Actinomycetota bacterium]|nr:metallophosphoesterase [Actinomycetota bacterium]
MQGRNADMVRRIEGADVRRPFTFVVAGDSGAYPDPTADGIFGALVRQVGELDPAPAFFANLGDFAGPGTRDRHDHYLGLVEPLDVPNLCVLGNHDVDDDAGPETFEDVHGPANFSFAYGDTRFVVLRSVPGVAGEIEVPTEGPLAGAGPRDDDLAFLAAALEDAREPHRVVLMHMPPSLGGHHAPHEDWGFTQREDDFLGLLRAQRVTLVCCAHGLAFDTVVHDGIRFVMSGGGGTGLCSHYRGVCTQGPARPEDRGAIFHAVEITVAASGDVSGRVLQAFAAPDDPPRITF